MGGCTGSCESASERLWSLVVFHRGRPRMHWLPLLGRRVRRLSFLFLLTPRISPVKRASSVSMAVHSSDDYLRRIKALLFTLVRGFEFELALPAEDIIRTTSIVGHPTIASNPAAGPQLPLLIRPANMD
jgi:hypothetical protein